ncbi:DUF2357 domain-containing protein [Fictibacillus enclensis]|uniref:DUF2357 domain-containing protein n=1 Tax=Fictibacillus enclensis TaxID=1017270 RepID=UPI0024BFC432|nr:DUF2357 domain-containing protein [Fictibacillus enclensis]WHY73781.1 DUF2357 domain-containing protein [Fictibacillus enclensis]
MDQPSSGVKFFIQTFNEGWVSFDHVYFQEATSYRWKIEGEFQPNILFNGALLPFTITETGVKGTLITPFQSGEAVFIINDTEHKTYIYPDDRKVTNEQYEIMLNEILNEAAVCFDYSGLGKNFNAKGRELNISWTQWSYIKRSFHQLSLLFQKISNNPFSVLKQEYLMKNREKVQQISISTALWLEKNYGTTGQIPRQVFTSVRKETNDIYENQLLKKQLLELRYLLSQYKRFVNIRIKIEAEQLQNKVNYWLNHSFLINVQPLNGQVTVTQRLRKHPDYRNWIKWFDKLYQHQKYFIGFDYDIPLKDTYRLYEIWCYMKIIQRARKNGKLASTSELFKITSDGIFLSLAENKESTVHLVEGDTITYQKIFQYRNQVAHHSQAMFYTFTQRMIPDIVIQSKGKLKIYDPKYRIPSNIGTALGEMHKYRDGIRNIYTDDLVVDEVYILTPFQDNGEEMRFYKDSFHSRYKMGAVKMSPGTD